MSLETRIDDDWKAAMKAGEKARKDALSLLRAAIKQSASTRRSRSTTPR
jgi:uncharacterized protein YqeY